MNDHEKYQLCLRQAEQMTKQYRLVLDPYECNPRCWYVSTTLAVLAIVASLVGTGVSAYGASVSADAQSDAAKYNAAVARNNANSAAQQGAFDAQQIRDRTRRVLAQQRNAFAANGIVPDAGSAADVSADSAQQGEMQALMAIYTGKTSANSWEARARLNQSEAANASTAGTIAVGSSIIGGFGNAATIGMNNAPSFQSH